MSESGRVAKLRLGLDSARTSPSALDPGVDEARSSEPASKIIQPVTGEGQEP